MSDLAGAVSQAAPLHEDPAFRRRRTQNWLVLGFLYAFFYATRYNFTALAHPLSHYFGWSNTDFGVFESVLPLAYGASVLINGPIADRIGGKKAFLIGAAGVTLMNFLFGLGTFLVATPAVWSGEGKAATIVAPAVLRYGLSPSTVLFMMATVWTINGYFQ